MAWGEGGWIHPSDTLETPDPNVARDFLNVDLTFEMLPETLEPQAHLWQTPMHAPHTPCPYPFLMSAFPPGCQESLCRHYSGRGEMACPPDRARGEGREGEGSSLTSHSMVPKLQHSMSLE